RGTGLREPFDGRPIGPGDRRECAPLVNDDRAGSLKKGPYPFFSRSQERSPYQRQDDDPHNPPSSKTPRVRRMLTARSPTLLRTRRLRCTRVSVPNGYMEIRAHI